ncbi:hypothetical protein LXL04_036110 [Taraxacum kok-saghyz]
MLLPFTLILFTLQFTTSMNTGKPGCLTKCGEVTVPYPFGIQKGCSIDDSFELTCDTTSNPRKLFLNTSQNIEIYSINISGSDMKVSNSVAYNCYNKSGDIATDEDFTQIQYNLQNTPFTFSQKNKFTVIGCDDFAIIEGKSRVNFSGSCVGICSKKSDVRNGECSGIGCCQTPIPKGVKSYVAGVSSFNNRTDVKSFNPCSIAFLGDTESFRFRGAPDLFINYTDVVRRNSVVPMVIDWEIGGNGGCAQATECKGNSFCNDTGMGGYNCICNQGYEGNPYLDPGCIDINECLDKQKYPCYGDCINTEGSYGCTCKPGYTGNGTIPDNCRLNVISGGSKFPAKVFSLALVFGSLAILSGITGIFLAIRKRKLIKLRKTFFEKNGGLFLQQKLNAPEATYAVTLFTTEELQKATDNYSEELIVGRGGYGLVYKGILPDKRVVAIKKSILVDGTQAEQFIHEVSIITQVIHRNVVKLLGCCLEEKVPVLVYEFISNNTLFYHLHHRSGGMSWLSWENRLRVAAEAASALAYLHSQATMPIIHRDVKSANILLDENYTAKISDFGASRLVPLDHDQVTTLVQGTLGYLDPEYFHTSQLTDKSDVYSFGMVLAELITGKKTISADRTNHEKHLATYFVKSMKENRLLQILEPQLLREGTLEQLQTVAELVKRCLNLLGEDRPTMREVAMELEGLRKFTTHPWFPQQTPEKSRSLTLEVEQYDLYDVSLIPYSSNEY